jgi:hypothetical protein
MRQVQTQRPQADAVQGHAASTTTFGPRTFAVDTAVYSLVQLSGEGKGGFDAGRILWHPPFVNAGSRGFA